MLDSTVVERVGKYLTPDERIAQSCRRFKEFMETPFFKAIFRRRCEQKLLSLKGKHTYYGKYRKPDLSRALSQIERALLYRRSAGKRKEDSSLLQGRISKLEFLFKKISITRHSLMPKR